jgi:hypothetical protein
MRNTEKPADILADLYDGQDGKPLTPAEFLQALGSFQTTADTFSKWKHSPLPDERTETDGKQPENKSQVRTYLMPNETLRDPVAVYNAAEAALDAIYSADLTEADTKAALEQLCETAGKMLTIPGYGRRTRGKTTTISNNISEDITNG